MHRVAILLPATAYRAEDFIRAARAEQAEVVVVSDHMPTIGVAQRAGFVRVDFDKPESAADLICEAAGPLAAIIPADDAGVMVAALVAERLGLPHNPPAAVASTIDKSIARQKWAQAGVVQPRFSVVNANDAEQQSPDFGFPVVVKPVDRSASQGVIRADGLDELRLAVRRVGRLLGEGPMLVEEFVPGPEYAVDGLLDDGGFTPLAVFDKPDQPDGPYFEETLMVAPARLDGRGRVALLEATEQAARALGLRHGPIHAEFRRPPGGTFHVIEIAARSIGGLCGRSLRFSILGTSLEAVLVKHALGRPTVNLDARAPASGALMLPIDGGGTLVGITGTDRAAAVPGVVGVEITAPPGTELLPLPEGDRYLGFVFAQGQSATQVEAALRAAQHEIEVTWEA